MNQENLGKRKSAKPDTDDQVLITENTYFEDIVVVKKKYNSKIVRT